MAKEIEVEIRRDITVFPNKFRIFVFVDGDVTRLSIREAKELRRKLDVKIENAKLAKKSNEPKR